MQRLLLALLVAAGLALGATGARADGPAQIEGQITQDFNGAVAVTTQTTGQFLGWDGVQWIATTASSVALPLPPSQGGTGVSSPTAHAVPIAEGSSNFAFVAAVASGSVLASAGTSTDPQMTLLSRLLDAVGGSVPGSILYRGSTTAGYTSLADVATGQVLASGGVGVAPAYTSDPLVTSLYLGASDTRISRQNGGLLNATDGATSKWTTWGQGGFWTTAGGSLGFTDAALDSTSTVDTRLSRSSAGVMRFGTTANNAAGSLEATNGTLSGSILLSPASSSIFFESADGSGAAVSGAATGRLRYNNSTGNWETSTKGAAYAALGNTYPVAPASGTATATAGSGRFAAGPSASVTSNDGTALGDSASVSGGAFGTAVGRGATASGGFGIALGDSASAGAAGDVVVGASASSAGSGTQNTVLGYSSSVSANHGQCSGLGGSQVIGGDFGVAVGYAAAVTGNGGIAIGANMSAPANSCVIGGDTSDAIQINDVYFGAGVTEASTSAVALRATGGTGADRAGWDLAIIPGLSTGAATPSKFQVKIGTALGSGSTAQTPTERFRVDASTVTVSSVAFVATNSSTTAPGARFGSFAISPKTVTGSTSLDTSAGLWVVNSGSATTQTLPDGVSNGLGGFEIRVKNIGAGTVTLQGFASGQTIFNASAVSTLTLVTGDCYTLIFDNVTGTWMVIS